MPVLEVAKRIWSLIDVMFVIYFPQTYLFECPQPTEICIKVAAGRMPQNDPIAAS